MAERVFNLPDLGEGLEDAEIVEWKVAEGDTVELNQPLVEVNTAKALVEIPSPFAGKVTKLHGAEGDVVEVGTPLVTMDVEEGTETAAAEPQAATAATQAEAEKPKREAVLVGYGVDAEGKGGARRPRLRPPGERKAPAAGGRRAKRGAVAASPVVRRLARERGVDLASIEGSGPGGRVTREDVASASGTGAAAASIQQAAPAPAAGAEERVPVRGARRLIARKMARAWAEIPHVTTFRTVDASWLEDLRQQLSDDSRSKVTPLAVVVRAFVEICKKHPKLNSSFDAEAEELVLKGHYHVGIATDTEQGLMVPVIRDADTKGIVTLAREIVDVVAATREGRATPEQLTGSTVTVTNVGTFGSEFGTPIINLPEAAILALGVVQPRALVVEGRVEPRPAVTLSLSFDHRIIDGAEAGRAMSDLRDLLEAPLRLGALPQE